MEEWKEYKLGDLCSISSSKRIFANEYQLSGIPFYRGKEIIEKQKGEPITNELYISEDRFNEIKEKYGTPQNGDMLLTSVGTLGIPYIVKDEEFYFKDGNLTWFYNFRGINNVYLYYWFLSPVAQYLINAKAIGSTQKALTIDTLKKFDILLPPIEVQNQIVSILKSLDDKIEANRRINENLEQQAQALFKSWFVDFEPFKDQPFVESELGMIPHGWKVQEVQEVFDINIGKTPPRKESEWFSESNEDNVWVSIADMGSCGAFISDSSEYLTDEAVRRFNVQMVEKDSILLSFKLTVGRVAIADTRLTTNEAIARFILPKKFYREFLYLYLKQYKYGNLGSTSSIATAVNSKTIKGMRLLIPNVELIESFSKNTRPLFEQIRTIQQESRRLAELRDALLPRLMSGELKVNEIEK